MNRKKKDVLIVFIARFQQIQGLITGCVTAKRRRTRKTTKNRIGWKRKFAMNLRTWGRNEKV
jgi:hypothetical protein